MIEVSIHIGLWQEEEGVGVPYPAAFACLPPAETSEDGEDILALLEVHPEALDEIAQDDLHEFILKWERYALCYCLPFEVCEDFEVVEDCWQVVGQDEAQTFPEEGA